jgi:LemA protein
MFTPDFLLWCGIAAAVLLFWAIGAYSRLARLRAGARKAFAALDEQLMRQIVWVQGCLPESMRGGQTAPAELHDQATLAWARVRAASDQFAAALARARQDALADVPTLAGVVLAHEALRTAWAGALVEAVAPDAVPSAERLQARWLRLLHQSLPLRTVFNEAAQAYNAAIAQFPASLMARLIGFRAAGTATRLAEPEPR